MKHLKRLPLWLRLAWKECLHHRWFSFFFALNLALGLFGLVAIDTFKGAIQQDLQLRSKSILTADVSISSIRSFAEQEPAILKSFQSQGIAPATVKQVRERSLYSMVTSPLASRLVDIQAIENGYPLYGELSLRKQGLVTGQTPKKLDSEPRAWVYPEVLAQLGLNLGDTLRIGETTFTLTDVVEKDVGTSGIGFRFAPRVYIGQRWLESTGLIQPGSRVNYYQRFRFAEGTDTEAVAAALRTSLPQNLRVRTHQDTSQDLLRALNKLNDYLGLVALVALFLASIGATYLFRSFLLGRSGEIAVLLSLGLSPRGVWALYTAQLVILGLGAAVMALGFSLLLLPALPGLLGDFVPTGLDLRPGARLFALAALLGLGGSLFFCWPLLGYLRHLRPGELFRENAQPRLRFDWRQAMAYLPAILLYGALAVWQANSWRIGAVVMVSFVVAAGVLGGFAWCVLQALEFLFKRSALPLRLASRQLARQPVAAISCFLAMGLAVLLLTLIPQLRNGLLADLEASSGQSPALFLFDIQEEQTGELKSFLEARQTPLQTLYPMVRVQMTSLKGRELGVSDADGENAEDRRLQDRRHNVSTRQELLLSETLLAGQWFAPNSTYDWNQETLPLAAVSISEDFSEEMQLEVGDRFTLDLQGVAIPTRVSSIRKVRWTQFEPNFRILIQPGVIEDAPKTWIGTVGELPPEEKVALQQALVQQFPTLSLIDVSHLIEEVLNTLGEIASILQSMSVVVLIAGFAVLYAISNHQAASRVADVALLKVLGSSFALIRMTLSLELVLLTLTASSTGAAAGMAISFVVNLWVFESSPWAFSWGLPLTLVAGCTLLSLGVSALSTRRALKAEPKSLLGSI